MPYLTHEEYSKFGYTDIESDEFDRLLPKASDFLDVQTRNFYQFNDLEADINFRKNKFKKAIALQIEFMFEADATSSYSADVPTELAIGRMRVASKGGARGIVSSDAITMLSGTGLLFRGVN